MAAPAPAPPAPPSIDIGALIERGCFGCLERALAEAQRRNDPVSTFEAAALLTLRAKELGLPHQAYLDTAGRAARLRDEVASASAQGASADKSAGHVALLEIVAAMPPDPLIGVRDGPPARGPARLRADAAKVDTWFKVLDAASASPAFVSYLTIALRCSSAGPAVDAGLSVSDSLTSIPIVRYRLGLCGNGQAEHLRAVRTADAEFVDADYPLGRYALQLRPYPDADGGIRLLQSAAAAFPASPAIATALGDANQDIEEWSAALRAYDAALALVSDHPEALIGRTVALSGLNEHLAAIETATRLMAGQLHLGDAYYWRAWNHFQLGNLDVARADADRMKSLRINARAYLLSGMIDWRLQRRESAEVEFENALNMDFGQCEAATFLGGVRNELGKSREALAAFKQAVQCWGLQITVRQELIRTIQASNAPETFKAREIPRHERGIALAEKRRAEAANGVDLLEKYLTSLEGPPRAPQP